MQLWVSSNHIFKMLATSRGAVSLLLQSKCGGISVVNYFDVFPAAFLYGFVLCWDCPGYLAVLICSHLTKKPPCSHAGMHPVCIWTLRGHFIACHLNWAVLDVPALWGKRPSIYESLDTYPWCNELLESIFSRAALHPLFSFTSGQPSHSHSAPRPCRKSIWEVHWGIKYSKKIQHSCSMFPASLDRIRSVWAPPCPVLEVLLSLERELL